MIGFCTNFHCFRESLCASRKKHEFLECKLVSGMRSAINDVESWGGENKRRFDARKIGEMLVERNALLGGSSLRDSNGDTKDGVCTEFSFVRCTIELDKEIINICLGSDVKA